MKKHLLLLLFCTLYIVAGAQTATRLHVKSGSVGDGSSWSSAMDLQAALEAASNGNYEIWVAEGRYVPSVIAGDILSTDVRDKVFVIPANVKVYGSFFGTEMGSDYTCRRGSRDNTVLSGDISNTPSNDADDCYHVVIMSSTIPGDEFLLDGFTIKDNKADGSNLIAVNGHDFLGSRASILCADASIGNGTSGQMAGEITINNNVIIGGIFAYADANAISDGATVGNSGRVYVSNNDITGEAIISTCAFANDDATSSVVGNGGRISVSNNTLTGARLIVEAFAKVSSSSATVGNGGEVSISNNTCTDGLYAATYAHALGVGSIAGSGGIVSVFNNKVKGIVKVYTDTYSKAASSSTGNGGVVSIFKNTITEGGITADVYTSTFSSPSTAGSGGKVSISNNTINGFIQASAYASALSSTSAVGNGGEICLINNTIVSDYLELNAFTTSDTSTGGKVMVINTLVWGNTDPDISFDLSKKHTIAFKNSLLIGKTASDLNNYLNPGSGSGNLDASGLNSGSIFVNYSGGDYRLREGSTAVNSGNNSLYDQSLYGNVDVAGNIRIQGGTIDLGAYESSFTPEIPCVSPKIVLQPAEVGVCKGSDSALSVLAEGDDLSYQWYFNNNLVFEANENELKISNASSSDFGVYYVEVKGHCGRALSESVTFWVIDSLPANLSFSDLPSPAYVGRSHKVKLSGWANVTNYSWRYEGSGSISFKPASGKNNETQLTFQTPGEGTLYVDLEHACGSRTAFASIQGTYPTGLNVLGTDQLKIYPNPVRDKLTIELPQNATGSVDIVDLNGRRVYTSRTVNSRLDLNVSSWLKGAYLVRVVTDKQTLIEKIVKY